MFSLLSKSHDRSQLAKRRKEEGKENIEKEAIYG